MIVSHLLLILHKKIQFLYLYVWSLKCGKRSQSSRGPNTFARHCSLANSYWHLPVPCRLGPGYSFTVQTAWCDPRHCVPGSCRSTRRWTSLKPNSAERRCCRSPDNPPYPSALLLCPRKQNNHYESLSKATSSTDVTVELNHPYVTVFITVSLSLPFSVVMGCWLPVSLIPVTETWWL